MTKALNDTGLTALVKKIKQALFGKQPKKLEVAITTNGSTITADKTYQEIVAAYSAGADIVLSEGGYLYTLICAENGYFEFENVPYDEYWTRYRYTLESDGTWSFYDINLQERLVSGMNIKTINNGSVLGGENLTLTPKVEYASTAAMEADNTQPSGAIGYNQEEETWNIYDQPSGEWRRIDGGELNEIASITTSESSVSGGNNSVTITETNGTSHTFNVKNGKDGKDGQDGADGVSLGEIALVQTTGDSTNSVMSQKAVTDAIEDISNKVNLPSTAVMKDNKYTSVKKYNISDLMNVWYIEKGLAKRALSWGWRNDLWFTLWKDSRNYFGVYRNDSSIKARLVVNNSVIKTENLVAAQASTTNAYASVAFCIDLNRKVISCYSISSGALTTVGSVDISTWDLSSFSEVSIYNNAFGSFHWVACDRIVINDYFDVESLLKYQFAEGRYNTLSNQAKQDPVIIPHTSLLVGGTVTSEISNVHKISSVTNNNGAFTLGPSVATGAKGRYFVKFKITSGTCNVTLGNGEAPILLDSNFNYLRTLTSVQSALENDTIYVLVVAVNGSFISGAVTSFLRAYGSFTIETLDCGAFITQSMNVCAETFDGQYYIGNIPFKANSSSWINEVNWDTNDNTTFNGIAKYARYVNASGNIMMFNGTVWKQINNS